MKLRAVLILTLWLPVASTQAATEAAKAVATAPVQGGNITPTVTAWGAVQPDPDRQHTLVLPRAAIIGPVYVRSGQTVAAGAPLLDFTTAPTVQQDHAQAVSAFDYARRNRARSERLFAEQLATRADLDAARRDLRDAQSRLAALSAVGAGTDRGTLRAPLAGIVTEVLLAPGARVPADTPAVSITDRQALVAALGIEPETAARIATNAKARISSVFGPAPGFTGHVTAVQAIIDPATHLLGVLVPIPADSAVYPIGAALRAQIDLPEETTLRIPRAALLADGSGTYVFVLRQGHAQRVNVTAGLPVGGEIIVSGALQMGERVITAGGRELGDGDAVEERAP